MLDALRRSISASAQRCEYVLESDFAHSDYFESQKADVSD